MTILLDNILYNVFISRYVIYIKNSVNNNILYKVNTMHNKSIDAILKNKTKYNILIELINNNIKLSLNNNTLIDHNFDKNKIKHNVLKNGLVLINRHLSYSYIMIVFYYETVLLFYQVYFLL